MRSQAMSFVWVFARADSPAMARPVMRRPSPSKPLRVRLAALFAATTILYTALWMYGNFRPPSVEWGFNNEYLQAEHCNVVSSVQNGSPVERAGLRAGDRIIDINGRHIENTFSIVDVWAAHHPGVVLQDLAEKTRTATDRQEIGLRRNTS
jgi:membrane-associated protease RseP (regulator of RpoE activity)